MQTAMIAHGLAMLGRERFGRQVDPERVTVIALYHDASEAITGDLRTPTWDNVKTAFVDGWASEYAALAK